MVASRRGRRSTTCSALRFSFLSHNIPNCPTDITLGVFNPLLLSFTGLSRSHFCNCSERIDSQQHPAVSKQLITGCCAGHCPHFSNLSVGCQVWLLHIPSKRFFFKERG